MTTPNHLKYTKTHEWVELISEDKARIGLTDYAQDSLGSLVFINLPEVGEEVIKGESFADVESVKAVSDVNAPINGVVTAVNEELLDAPELINDEPYDTWLVELNAINGLEELLDADDYEAFLREEE